MSFGNDHDPRAVLVREKFFSMRPRPLEHWLWRHAVAPSAERVFWLHWAFGLQAGTWCSAIPLKRVAAECCLDVSTVTRAYQQLTSLGLVRRCDPGRDPSKPFAQAIAITEVRVPVELIRELSRHPSRPRGSQKPPDSAGSVSTPAVGYLPAAPAPSLKDPFSGLTIRQRLQRISALETRMSAAELSRFRETLRTHSTALEFDADSELAPDERGLILQFLSTQSRPHPLPVAPPPGRQSRPEAIYSGPRHLSVFELARLRREVARTVAIRDVQAVFGEVLWSVQEGTLRRFQPLHAVNIALKKIREGGWTRPNRMPPNWRNPCRADASPEQCATA